MKVAVIGAGPSGSHAAYRLAKAGYVVELFEEHKEIGLPIACTGLVTKSLYDFVPRDKYYIINEMKSAKLISKRNSAVVPLHEDIICRHKFDKWMAKRAESAGAKIFTNHRLAEINKNELAFISNGKTIKKEFDIIIGADGPISQTAKSAGLYGNRKFWIGMQVTIEGRFKKDQFEAYFGDICPEFFAWVVPESNTLARVGIATLPENEPKKHFDAFIKKIGGKIKATQAGPIPWHKPKKVSKNSIYLVGDAAGLVKATTGGGIITGIWSSEILADCIINKKNYEWSLLPLRFELMLHNKLRSMLNKFKDRDYDELLRLISTDNVKEVLKNNPREKPSKFAMALTLASPKLLKFAKFAI